MRFFSVKRSDSTSVSATRLVEVMNRNTILMISTRYLAHVS